MTRCGAQVALATKTGRVGARLPIAPRRGTKTVGGYRGENNLRTRLFLYDPVYFSFHFFFLSFSPHFPPESAFYSCNPAAPSSDCPACGRMTRTPSAFAFVAEISYLGEWP